MIKYTIEYTNNSISYYPLYLNGGIIFVRIFLSVFVGFSGLMSICMIFEKSWDGLALFLCSFVFFAASFYFCEKAANTKIIIDRLKYEITGGLKRSNLCIQWSDICEIEFHTSLYNGRTYMKVFADSVDKNHLPYKKCVANLLQTEIDRQKFIELLPSHIFVYIT